MHILPHWWIYPQYKLKQAAIYFYAYKPNLGRSWRICHLRGVKFLQ